MFPDRTIFKPGEIVVPRIKLRDDINTRTPWGRHKMFVVEHDDGSDHVQVVGADMRKDLLSPYILRRTCWGALCHFLSNVRLGPLGLGVLHGAAIGVMLGAAVLAFVP